MQDDPVRVALFAATLEAETWQRDAARRRRICPADAMERMTAAAVAAFLRALPHTGTMGCGAYEGCVTSSDHARNSGVWHAVELAREVDRAAREAGE